MLTLDRSTSLKIAASVGAVTVALIPIGVALFPSQPEQKTFTVPLELPAPPRIDPAWDNNPNYCQERPIEDCYTQFRLRMDGYQQAYLDREAMRYRAAAVTQATLPHNQSCFRQSEPVCLSSFAENITNVLNGANSNAEWLEGISRATALSDAQMGKVAAVPAVPDRFRILATIENWQSQLALHYGMGEAAARTQLDNGKLIYSEQEVKK